MAPNHLPLFSRCGLLLVPLLCGCSSHIPPAVDLGAPLPPGAVQQHGFDAIASEHFWFSMPVTPSFRGAGSLPLGDGPWALELGGNLGATWAGLAPALHWVPNPRAGSSWRFGGRLGLALGTGDATRNSALADPYAGLSLLGQASRPWGWSDVGGFTVALGWGYAGYLRCPLGCSIPDADPEPDTDEGPDYPNSEGYLSFNGPTLHLRLDIPAGQGGGALMLGASTQPMLSKGDVGLVWSLAVGIHHRKVGF